MSCIAGVGGDVSSLVKVARNAEKILVLDGCSLSCALKCLKRHDKEPTTHLILTDFDLSKNMHTDFTEEEFIFNYTKVKNFLE